MMIMVLWYVQTNHSINTPHVFYACVDLNIRTQKFCYIFVCTSCVFILYTTNVLENTIAMCVCGMFLHTHTHTHTCMHARTHALELGGTQIFKMVRYFIEYHGITIAVFS